MAFVTKDRVMETATTTGTGDFTLAGTVDRYQAFSAVCSTGDLVEYAIEGAAGTGEYETGIGTYSAANTLTRTTVIESSNSDAAVNFSAGTKYVFMCRLARFSQPYLIATQATASGTSVSFTSIPQYYSSLVFEFLGWSHDSGSNQSLQIELSGDNGSTWTTAVAIGQSFAAGGAGYGAAIIHHYMASAGMITAGSRNMGSDYGISGLTPAAITYRVDGGIDAVRFSPAGAANFDAGSIKLWGLG